MTTSCVHPQVCPSRRREGSDAWVSARLFIGKRTAEVFEIVKSARYLGMSAEGVLLLESQSPDALRRAIAGGGLNVWLAKAGQMIGVTGVEVLSVTNSSEGAGEMIETSGSAVQVTEQQLRKALVTLLGSSAQVTARRELNRVLPKQRKAIAWQEWQAAAEAEGLQIEAEKPWGITIWRKGAAKQPVPAIAQRSASKTAAQQQSAASVPDDAQKIAVAARTYMDAQRKAGREVSATDAVHAVLKQRSAGSK